MLYRHSFDSIIAYSISNIINVRINLLLGSLYNAISSNATSSPQTKCPVTSSSIQELAEYYK